MSFRIEHDLLGDREVPADAYWGVHSLRASEIFPITGIAIGHYPALVNALALIKQAAAMANGSVGLLDAPRVDAIVSACVRIREGALHDQFVVDVIQGGLQAALSGCSESHRAKRRAWRSADRKRAQEELSDFARRECARESLFQIYVLKPFGEGVRPSCPPAK